jgi:haloalkane dehalogenase
VAFSATDPVFAFPRAGDQFTTLIPTADEQVGIAGAAHFLHEDAGDQVVDAMLHAFGRPTWERRLTSCASGAVR